MILVLVAVIRYGSSALRCAHSLSTWYRVARRGMRMCIFRPARIADPVSVREFTFGVFIKATVIQKVSGISTWAILVGVVGGEEQPIATGNGQSTLQIVGKEPDRRLRLDRDV